MHARFSIQVIFFKLTCLKTDLNRQFTRKGVLRDLWAEASDPNKEHSSWAPQGLGTCDCTLQQKAAIEICSLVCWMVCWLVGVFCSCVGCFFCASQFIVFVCCLQLPVFCCFCARVSACIRTCGICKAKPNSKYILQVFRAKRASPAVYLFSFSFGMSCPCQW